ncbi:MAG: tetratricopeptide repeat protein [Bryobacteraceae bacterium]|nr:tetratricopeptide repeat protein [Bryobacteraceae bacterium]
MWLKFGSLLFSAILLSAAQPPPADLARKALAAREAGRLQESIDLYRKALSQRPLDPESWWYQGLNYFDLNRYAEAETAFARLVEQNPEHGGGLTVLGLCEFRSGKYETAFAHIVLGRQKGIPAGSELEKVAHRHYLMLANKIGQFELASDLLADMARDGSSEPILVELAGLSALRLSLLPAEAPATEKEKILLAGRAAVDAWANRLDDALKAVNTLAALYPRQPNVHYLRGYVLSLRQSDEAMAEFRKELEISPKHVQARLRIAYEYLQRGEAEAGLPYAKEAAALAPEDFSAQTVYGRLLLDANRLKEAVLHLEKAVKLAPTNPDAHFQLATAYGRSGRDGDAARHRKIFLDLNRARQGP